MLDGVVTATREGREPQQWLASRDGISVNVSWTPRWLNEGRRLVEETLALEVHDEGRIEILEHKEIRKRYFVRDFIREAGRSGEWESVHTCSDFDMDRKIDEGRSMVILRRL